MAERCLTETDQREVTRICIQGGLLLMQHGAESALVENVMRRLGLALGAESVEVAIMANALTVTTLHQGNSITTVRRNEDRGINMHVITETQRLLLRTESKELDLPGVSRELGAIQAHRYPRWIVILVVGLSCAAFARLAKADLVSCGVTFVASSVAMAVRQQLGHLHFSPLVNFFVTAFVATSIAAQALIYNIGAKPTITMAASCLLLVPGVPLINSLSDMVKGYINTGLSRGTMALLLTLATCGGIVLAMGIWKVWAWL